MCTYQQIQCCSLTSHSFGSSDRQLKGKYLNKYLNKWVKTNWMQMIPNRFENDVNLMLWQPNWTPTDARFWSSMLKCCSSLWFLIWRALTFVLEAHYDPAHTGWAFSNNDISHVVTCSPLCRPCSKINGSYRLHFACPVCNTRLFSLWLFLIRYNKWYAIQI